MNLVLIPKVAHPELITQFHPISLSNTLYKLLSRIIVHWLKPDIVEVINPCQAGFMLGCCTSDNIIIIQEVIRTLISRWGRTGYVALKSARVVVYLGNSWIFSAASNPHYPHHEYDILHSVPYFMEWLSSPESGAQSRYTTGWPSFPILVYPLFGAVVNQVGWGCSW